MCFVRVSLNTLQKSGHENQLCLGNKLEINVQIYGNIFQCSGDHA
jgi:hypothetical protein